MLIMLTVHIFEQVKKMEIKPIVTIILLFTNIYLYVVNTDVFGVFNSWDIHGNCMHPQFIFASLKENKILCNRVFLSAFLHANDSHLYYNMLSLLWKGANLETNMGSIGFSKLVFFSVLFSQAIFLLLSWTTGWSYNICTVGFSGVLFSLKYVLFHEIDGYVTVHNMLIEAKYAAWVELVLISVFVPNASFLGHLAGICAGILYLHGKELLHLVNGVEIWRSSQRYIDISGRIQQGVETNVSNFHTAEQNFHTANVENDHYGYGNLQEVEHIPISRQQLRNKRLQKLEGNVHRPITQAQKLNGRSKMQENSTAQYSERNKTRYTYTVSRLGGKKQKSTI